MVSRRGRPPKRVRSTSMCRDSSASWLIGGLAFSALFWESLSVLWLANCKLYAIDTHIRNPSPTVTLIARSTLRNGSLPPSVRPKPKGFASFRRCDQARRFGRRRWSALRQWGLTPISLRRARRGRSAKIIPRSAQPVNLRKRIYKERYL